MVVYEEHIVIESPFVEIARRRRKRERRRRLITLFVVAAAAAAAYAIGRLS